MFFDIPEGTKLILAGNNVLMETYRSFIDTYYMYYEITAIADTNASQQKEYLRGLAIVPYEEWETQEGVVVLFGKTWFKDGENLHRRGYTLGRDYIPAWFFEVAFKESLISFAKLNNLMRQGMPEQYYRYISYVKKIAVLYGDGNIPKINRILSRCKMFCDDYVIVSLPPVQAIAKGDAVVSNEIWQYISLFITQPVVENSLINEEHTSQTIIHKLRPNCKVVVIPALTFWGYFPQARVNKKALRTKNKNGSLVTNFPFSDLNIENAIRQGLDVEKIVAILGNDNVYSLEEVQNFCEDKILEIEDKEKDCDVKYAQWVRQNYKRKKLFLNPTLPSYDMVIYLVKEILNIVGYTNSRINENDLEWDEYESGDMPIYKIVAKDLFLDFDVSHIKGLNSKNASCSDYVREYLSEYGRRVH